ncbi:MAG: aldolase/citrate lyase family protein [Desulfosalsimonas sp.]
MNRIRFMLITASPDVAAFAEHHGVDRIFLDQEVKGKTERQGHIDTHKTAHTPEQIEAVAGGLEHAEIMVRINPLHDGTRQEIEAAISHGARRLMLPMFTSKDQVAEFLDLVEGRAPVTFLAETPQALVRLSDWLPLLTPGHDEVHFGLNDLSIGMGLSFLFEPMAARLFDLPAEILTRTGMAWGVGGIARIGRGELPAEIVLGEHVRLGSGWVILSRAFHGGAASSGELLENLDFASEIAALREAEKKWRLADKKALMDNHCKLAELVFQLARRRQNT